MDTGADIQGIGVADDGGGVGREEVVWVVAVGVVEERVKMEDGVTVIEEILGVGTGSGMEVAVWGGVSVSWSLDVLRLMGSWAFCRRY